MYYAHELNEFGESERMTQCVSLAGAVILAKEWHEQFGSATLALDDNGAVIAEHKQTRNNRV